IAGLRLEALADPSLPSGGPGRNANGNFVLTGVKISAAPKDKPAEMKALKIISVSSDYDQPTFPASSLAQNPPPNGCAVDPKCGNSHLGVFNVEPAKFEPGASLSVELQFQSVHICHNIGMLRLAVTSSPAANAFSPEVLKAAQAAPESRTPEQKKFLAAYF